MYTYIEMESVISSLLKECSTLTELQSVLDRLECRASGGIAEYELQRLKILVKEMEEKEFVSWKSRYENLQTVQNHSNAQTF